MIFYFTGTGNSKYAAESIGNALGESVVPIEKALKGSQGKVYLDGEKYLGFVFPVYYFGIPNIVEEFSRRVSMEGRSGKGIFLVLTCGGTTGDAHIMFKKLIEKKGLILDYIFAVDMPDNYILMYDVQKPDQQETQLISAAEKMSAIIKKIIAEDKGDHNNLKGPFPSLMTKMAYPMYRMGRNTKSFYADDRCNSCGLCAEICPSDSIAIYLKKPEWIEDKCIHCLGCLHRCPQKAIQYGKKTEKRGRYVNPYTKLN